MLLWWNNQKKNEVAHFSDLYYFILKAVYVAYVYQSWFYMPVSVQEVFGQCSQSYVLIFGCPWHHQAVESV